MHSASRFLQTATGLLATSILFSASLFLEPVFFAPVFAEGVSGNAPVFAGIMDLSVQPSHGRVQIIKVDADLPFEYELEKLSDKQVLIRFRQSRLTQKLIADTGILNITPAGWVEHGTLHSSDTSSADNPEIVLTGPNLGNKQIVIQGGTLVDTPRATSAARPAVRILADGDVPSFPQLDSNPMTDSQRIALYRPAKPADAKSAATSGNQPPLSKSAVRLAQPAFNPDAETGGSAASGLKITQTERPVENAAFLAVTSMPPVEQNTAPFTAARQGDAPARLKIATATPAVNPPAQPKTASAPARLNVKTQTPAVSIAASRPAPSPASVPVSPVSLPALDAIDTPAANTPPMIEQRQIAAKSELPPLTQQPAQAQPAAQKPAPQKPVAEKPVAAPIAKTRPEPLELRTEHVQHSRIDTDLDTLARQPSPVPVQPVATSAAKPLAEKPASHGKTADFSASRGKPLVTGPLSAAPSPVTIQIPAAPLQTLNTTQPEPPVFEADREPAPAYQPALAPQPVSAAPSRWQSAQSAVTVIERGTETEYRLPTSFKINPPAQPAVASQRTAPAAVVDEANYAALATVLPATRSEGSDALLATATRQILANDRTAAITTLKQLLSGAQPTLAQSAKANYMLGTLYEDLGDTESALPYLLTAAKLSPASADVQYNLGLAYELSGNQALARAHYTKASQLDPSAQDIAKALQRVRR